MLAGLSGTFPTGREIQLVKGAALWEMPSQKNSRALADERERERENIYKLINETGETQVRVIALILADGLGALGRL